MEQFNLDTWLKDKSRKVVTRDEREVEIYYNPDSRIPLIGRTEDNEIHQYTKDGFQYDLMNQAKNDLFFADEEKLNRLIDELKYYLEKTPKEQVEKDWKEIQDWYTQHFTNKKHNEEDELTEFEKAVDNIINYPHFQDEQAVKQFSKTLLDLARKEIEKENSEFKPKFTYNEKDYSKLANKLIEFRNNTPLCSVSYRDGEGREVILHYEKEILDLVKNEILKDFPKWKKAKESRHSPYGAVKIDEDGEIIYSDIIWKGEYFIMLQSLKTLSKEE